MGNGKGAFSHRSSDESADLGEILRCACQKFTMHTSRRGANFYMRTYPELLHVVYTSDRITIAEQEDRRRHLATSQTAGRAWPNQIRSMV